MFMYFVEQVWTDGIRDYNDWNVETEDMQHSYWELYNYTDMSNNVVMWLQPHMELGVDYIEW
ncbi:hypothetical protein LCGC14_2041820 [marine sediment metagenome]|uniref:Uncharacterized protein n=1 Tax=marine sediment metagenome TaxID=412755 RepID=A0A0F9HNL7_9ZZZZ